MSQYIGLLNVNELNLDSLVTNTLTVLQSETASLIQATDSTGIVIKSSNNLYDITVDDTGIDIKGNVDMNGFDILNVGDIGGITGGTGGDLFVNGDIFVTGDVFVNDDIHGGTGFFNYLHVSNELFTNDLLISGKMQGNVDFNNHNLSNVGIIQSIIGNITNLTTSVITSDYIYVNNGITGSSGYFNKFQTPHLSVNDITFTGGDNTNLIIVPTSLSNAFEIEDTNANNYMQINSSTQITTFAHPITVIGTILADGLDSRASTLNIGQTRVSNITIGNNTSTTDIYGNLLIDGGLTGNTGFFQNLSCNNFHGGTGSFNSLQVNNLGISGSLNVNSLQLQTLGVSGLSSLYGGFTGNSSATGYVSVFYSDSIHSNNNIFAQSDIVSLNGNVKAPFSVFAPFIDQSDVGSSTLTIGQNHSSKIDIGATGINTEIHGNLIVDGTFTGVTATFNNINVNNLGVTSIDGHNISTTQFGYLSNMNQNIASTSTVVFAGVTATQINTSGITGNTGYFNGGYIKNKLFVGDSATVTNSINCPTLDFSGTLSLGNANATSITIGNNANNTNITCFNQIIVPTVDYPGILTIGPSNASLIEIGSSLIQTQIEGQLSANINTNSTSTSTGAIITIGGIGCAKNITCSSITGVTGNLTTQLITPNIDNTGTLSIGVTSANNIIIGSSGATACRIYSPDILFPNRPRFLATPTSNQSSSINGSLIDVAFGTKTFDVGNNFSTPTFTTPFTGLYLIGVGLLVTPNSGVSQFLLQFTSSNATYSGYRIYENSLVGAIGGNQVTMHNSLIMSLTAGDTLKVQFQQTGATGNTTIFAGVTVGSGFWATMLC